MNLQFIRRLPWFELSLLLVMMLIGSALFALLQLESADREDFERVQQAASKWQSNESSNLLHWQRTESTNFLNWQKTESMNLFAKDQSIQLVISELQSRFSNELNRLNNSQLKDNWADLDAYRVHDEYLLLATNMESGVRSMHSKLTNYAGRRDSPDFERADFADLLKSSRDLKNSIAEHKDRADADRFRARSVELKERINPQNISGVDVPSEIKYDLGSLLLEFDRTHTEYLAQARNLTNKVNKVSDPLFMRLLVKAGKEAEHLIKLAQQAHSDGERILAFLNDQWQSAVQQRTEALRALEQPLVTGKSHLEILALLHTNAPTPTISSMPIASVIDNALKQTPKSSAYSKALYPLLIAQIGLGGFLLVALYRRLVVEKLRLNLYETKTENKLTHLGELAARLAHEIKQPLTAINAWLWTLQKRVTKEMPEHMGTTAIRKEINRLDQVLKDFRNLIQPAAPRLVPLKPALVLREVLELMGPQLKRKGIQLNLESSVEAGFGGDPHQIKQVLINLVNNAAESMEQGGTITLRARKDKMQLNGRPEAVIVVEVEDTGSGIPPEVQQRLFDPFFSTKDQGTGLGLSIAAKIIDAHKGALNFTTALGEGTTFRI